MEDMKAQTELKLIAIQLADWCKHREDFVFNASLCSQERVIRFQTPVLLKLLPNIEESKGAWKTGCFFMYEIYNGVDEFKITCSVSILGLNSKKREDYLRLIENCNGVEANIKGLYFLKEWIYTSAARNLDKIMEALSDFCEFQMPYFEAELVKWKDDHEYHIKEFSDIKQIVLSKKESSEEVLVEGGMKDILTNKYERNITARKKCIAVYGTACQICGFDFGAVYGSEFAGKIHVHHKLPLYEIKENYVVDPVKDLIPVCPNCHMILHSKPGGFYTVEEVKELIEGRTN